MGSKSETPGNSWDCGFSSLREGEVDIPENDFSVPFDWRATFKIKVHFLFSFLQIQQNVHWLN